jgi:hypothetical protein
MGNWKKMYAAVVVPVSPETLAKIESHLKDSPGAECGPATWRDFMPKAEELLSTYGDGGLGVRCHVSVDVHYKGGFLYSLGILPGEAPDEDGQFKDPCEAMLAGVRYLLSFDDYGDIDEVQYMLEGKEGEEN